MLEVRNVSKVFGEGHTRVIALDDVCLEVNKGDFIAVMGPSGSGKSTLLNVIGGLDRLTSGEVILDSQRIDNLDENVLVEIRRGKIAYVFQQYHLLPSLTAIENVFIPLLWLHGSEDETLKIDTHGLPLWDNYPGSEGCHIIAQGSSHTEVPQTIGYWQYIECVRLFIQGDCHPLFTCKSGVCP